MIKIKSIYASVAGAVLRNIRECTTDIISFWTDCFDAKRNNAKKNTNLM